MAPIAPMALNEGGEAKFRGETTNRKGKVRVGVGPGNATFDAQAFAPMAPMAPKEGGEAKFRGKTTNRKGKVGVGVGAGNATFDAQAFAGTHDAKTRRAIVVTPNEALKSV